MLTDIESVLISSTLHYLGMLAADISCFSFIIVIILVALCVGASSLSSTLCAVTSIAWLLKFVWYRTTSVLYQSDSEFIGYISMPISGVLYILLG